MSDAMNELRARIEVLEGLVIPKVEPEIKLEKETPDGQ